MTTKIAACSSRGTRTTPEADGAPRDEMKALKQETSKAQRESTPAWQGEARH